MIDLINYECSGASQLFRRSFRETGFAILNNHPVSKDLIKQVYLDWENFFKSPKLNKQKYLLDQTNMTGYVPIEIAEQAKGYHVKDIKEFYNYREGLKCPQKQLKNTKKLRAELFNLANILLGWIEESMPKEIQSKLSEPLSSMIKGHGRYHLFRQIHYPALTGQEEVGAYRAAAHEDINLITILATATQPGLQVKDIYGTWHDVICEPGTLIINSGEMLEIATERYYPATTHQVLNPTGKAAKSSRYSMPFFLHARDDVYLTNENTAKDFLEKRLLELGLRKS